jgi:hypothetical protein
MHRHARRLVNEELTYIYMHLMRGGIGGTFAAGADAGEEDEEQEGQGHTEEGTLAVRVLRYGVEGETQKAEP